MRFLLMHAKKRWIKSWAGQKRIIEKCYASALVHYGCGVVLVLVPAHLLAKPDVASRERFAGEEIPYTPLSDHC